MSEDLHLSNDVLEQFVLGALDEPSARRLEEHVASCAACARALRREARLELELHALAEAAPLPKAAPARRWRRAAGVFSMAVAAVAAVAVVWASREQPPLQGAPRVVRCEDPRSAPECVKRAHYEGLLTLGPQREPEVPRYDVMPQQPPRGAP